MAQSVRFIEEAEILIRLATILLGGRIIHAEWLGEQSVISSNLVSVDYDPEESVLLIEFKGGSKYTYDDVPEAVYDGLMGAVSHGKFFWRNVRNDYSYRRVR